MKRTLILLCFIPLLLQGQGINVMHTALKPVVPPASGGASPTNMITNGTFDADTDWTKGIRWTISSGTANYNDLSISTIDQADGDMVSSMTNSTDYTVEFDIIISSGNANLFIVNYSGSRTFVAAANYAGGHHSVDFTSPADTESEGGGFGFTGHTDSDNAFSIDNVELYTR